MKHNYGKPLKRSIELVRVIYGQCDPKQLNALKYLSGRLTEDTSKSDTPKPNVKPNES